MYSMLFFRWDCKCCTTHSIFWDNFLISSICVYCRQSFLNKQEGSHLSWQYEIGLLLHKPTVDGFAVNPNKPKKPTYLSRGQLPAPCAFHKEIEKVQADQSSWDWLFLSSTEPCRYLSRSWQLRLWCFGSVEFYGDLVTNFETTGIGHGSRT